MDLAIRQCTLDDLLTLRELACKTYYETFKSTNTPANMKAYLENAFAVNKLRNELANSNSLFYFIYADEVLAGYLKLNDYPAQTDINDPQSLEIERLYVAKAFQAQHLGSTLINKAVTVASIRKKSYIWLGVWEHNHKALRFYQRNGFYYIGKHPFVMGDDEQTD